jgi:hypothetical protein
VPGEGNLALGGVPTNGSGHACGWCGLSAPRTIDQMGDDTGHILRLSNPTCHDTDASPCFGLRPPPISTGVRASIPFFSNLKLSNTSEARSSKSPMSKDVDSVWEWDLEVDVCHKVPELINVDCPRQNALVRKTVA